MDDPWRRNKTKIATVAILSRAGNQVADPQYDRPTRVPPPARPTVYDQQQQPLQQLGVAASNHTVQPASSFQTVSHQQVPNLSGSMVNQSSQGWTPVHSGPQQHSQPHSQFPNGGMGVDSVPHHSYSSQQPYDIPSGGYPQHPTENSVSPPQAPYSPPAAYSSPQSSYPHPQPSYSWSQSSYPQAQSVYAQPQAPYSAPQASFPSPSPFGRPPQSSMSSQQPAYSSSQHPYSPTETQTFYQYTASPTPIHANLAEPTYPQDEPHDCPIRWNQYCQRCNEWPNNRSTYPG